jgi:hypothetical protein
VNSFYDHQLALWKSRLPESAFCILSFEFFQKDPAAALDVARRFLGLRDFNWAPMVGSVKNFTFSEVSLMRCSFLSTIFQVELEETESLTKELNMFYSRIGREQYDLALQNNYIGCL